MFIAVVIFTIDNANKETENQSYAEILECFVVLQNTFTAIFDFMALIVERCFQVNDPSARLLLPGPQIGVNQVQVHVTILGSRRELLVFQVRDRDRVRTHVRVRISVSSTKA
ncbi:SMG7-like protein isoform X1 [Tanacetum coccineum]|uniref:SMG7-like protein isoform X1 n=1 Tax=Tanacetum coccineum TaxID=301880 RepID=A0ABQ5DCU0_9ASTR